jgi:hypothetical protein
MEGLRVVELRLLAELLQALAAPPGRGLPVPECVSEATSYRGMPSCLTNLLSRSPLLLNPCPAVLYGFAPRPVTMVRLAHIDRLTCQMCNVQLP